MKILLFPIFLVLAACVSFFATIYFLDRPPAELNICTKNLGRGIVLKRPFLRLPYGQLSGNGYSKEVHDIGAPDTSGHNNRSTLVVCEDEKPLGPAHSGHAKINTVGKGIYSHWDSQLYFSTSDNTNPNDNNRKYRVFSLVYVQN